MITRESWDGKKTIIDNVFAYVIALDNVKDNEESEPKIVSAKDMVLRKRSPQKLNKKIDTPEESTKQKKVIKMSTPEKYIQEKHVVELVHKEQTVPEEIYVHENKRDINKLCIN